MISSSFSGANVSINSNSPEKTKTRNIAYRMKLKIPILLRAEKFVKVDQTKTDMVAMNWKTTQFSPKLPWGTLNIYKFINYE